MDNKDFQKAVELINRSNSVLITTHTKADGDAAACCVAMSEALSTLGKKIQILFLSPLPQWYAFLFAEAVPVLGKDLSKEQLLQGKLGRFDLVIIVDTNSRSQLPVFDEYLRQAHPPVLIIDHHKTNDGLGDVELVDPHAAAASAVVLGLFKFARWSLTPKIAQALFTGIATDTGWFHFNNTDAVALRACAELADAGANPSQIFHNVYHNFSPPRFRLMTAMQSTLELHFDGRFATQHLSRQDFKITGAKDEDTENLIDECQRIASVEVAALFVELPDGRIRCSLRSRGSLDVCKIAAKFGGGGHTSAAGAYLPGPVENAKQSILGLVRQQLENV